MVGSGGRDADGKERTQVIRVGKAAAADPLSPGDVLAVSEQKTNLDVGPEKKILTGVTGFLFA